MNINEIGNKLRDIVHVFQGENPAVNLLTQNLSAFNLQSYLEIEGRITPGDLEEYGKQAVLKLVRIIPSSIRYVNLTNQQ